MQNSVDALVTATSAGDVVDAIVGLRPTDALYATRHARHKVSSATQASYELFFDPAATGISLTERLLVAWHACLLSGAADLAQHYREALDAHEVDSGVLDAIQANSLEQLSATRLKAMLVFAGKLITRPIEGDEAALKALQAAGMTTPDVVTLAQLVAFLSYQVRLVAGLAAMKALESK